MSSPKTPWLLIMAGGSGTRFWPRSRALRPKQLLPVVGEESLLTATIRRFHSYIPEDRMVILSTAKLETVTSQAIAPFRGTILAEPEGKNTAPSLLMAMAWLRQKDPEAVAIVVPADHWISDQKSFLEVMRTAVNFAEKGSHLVTIGITPTRPEVGYGYIRSGEAVDEENMVLAVERFVEKPKLEVAETMIQDPAYLWNAGMFVWSVGVFFREIGAFTPDLLRAFDPYIAALPSGKNLSEALQQSYKVAPLISIDYALLEKSSHVVVVPGTFDWNDLGSFQSLYELYPSCEGGVSRAKRVMAIDSCANLVDVPGKTVALLGVTNMMVVDVGDVLLIAAKEKSQDVKKFVDRLKAEGDPEHLL